MEELKEYTIYAIIHSETGRIVYIGKTKDFEKRQRQHIERCYNENSQKYNIKLYQYIRENGDFENYFFKVLIECECDKLKSIEYEKFYIELYDTLRYGNSNVPQVIDKDYINEWRKEYNKEYSKEYREKNKDKIKEYKKEYYDKNKDKIKEYSEKNKDIIKEYKKEYSEKNKDKIKEKIKEYREKNKDNIKEYQKEYREKNSELINCECGSSIKKYKYPIHIKTKKHQQYLSNK